ncbi:MAG: FtsW/RodA/SpoVE family cell cycle protein [Bacteroidales bacterium]|nr:FtsW/RodA/SpoVE family cell cycle protein [Bacteroidales bacterium]
MTRGDSVLWVVMIILSIISLIEVYTAIGKAAYDHDWSVTSTVLKHIGIVLLSYIAMVAVSRLKLRVFEKLAPLGNAMCVVLLLLVFVVYFYGKFSGGSTDGHAAQRWLNIPVIGQFQPSEIAKYVLIIYLASRISKFRDTLGELDTFKKLILPVILVSGLIFPENFSTSALVFLSCVILMYVGGVNRKYLGITILIVIGVVSVFLIAAFVFKIEFFRAGTWVNRITDWLNNDKEAFTQTNQAKIAIASGGFTGRGIGNTIQGRFLNESHTDFIYSVIVEEMGTLMGIFVIFLYLVFFLRCLSISRNCSSMFGQLTVAGLGIIIAMQAFINMGVAVGYLPVTGQTLPLISYGGTSYLFTCCAIGVILAVSHKNKLEAIEANNTAEKKDNNNDENNTDNESNN